MTPQLIVGSIVALVIIGWLALVVFMPTEPFDVYEDERPEPSTGDIEGPWS